MLNVFSDSHLSNQAKFLTELMLDPGRWRSGEIESLTELVVGLDLPERGLLARGSGLKLGVLSSRREWAR